MTSPAGRRYTIITAALGSSLAPFMVAGLTVAVPTIGKEFALDPVILSWVPTAFFLAAAMFLIPFGRIADIIGVKRIFTLGIAIYFFSALLAGLAPSAPVLIGARFLTGIGAAMIFATSFALLGLVLPESERGTALGINIAASFSGFALGFLMGGLLTYYSNWRVLFLATLPIDLIVIGIIRAKLHRECALSRGTHLDIPGIVLNVMTLLLIMVGFSLLPESEGFVTLIAGLVALAAFIAWEVRSQSPILNIRLFARNLPFAFANASVLVYYSASFAVIYLFSLYLQYIRGFDARLTGFALLFSTLITASLVGYAGRLSDRVSPYHVSMGGIMVSIVGLVVLSFIGPATPVVVVFGGVVLLAVGAAFFQPPIYNTVIGAIAREMYGVAAGLVETMRLLGMTISMAVTIVTFALFFGSAEITETNLSLLLNSMQAIFWVFLILAVVSLGVVWMVSRTGENS
jgi:MFS family permease